tara:strand:+ start:34 stop:996 length:963 start_codon:yes stop_codon:yes gene_type:complete
MKDLVTIFTYCPDNERKKVLQNLLEKLQEIRNDFDILLVSHSPILELSYDMVDYFYYDKNNKLLTDFDLNNDFWFKDVSFEINSTTVYPHSTHLAIYSLLYYTFNFANHKKYNKVHCIEYDINLSSTDLIYDINKNLDNYDNVMFKGENGWVQGTYFSFKIEGLPKEYFTYDEDFIVGSLRNSDTKMTENLTPRLLAVNERTTLYEPLSKLDPEGIFQKIDTHKNQDLNWCVPVYNKDTNDLSFFTLNTSGGEYDVDVLYNNKHINLKVTGKNTWSLTKLDNIDSINNITVLVNNKIKKQITLNSNNIEKFKLHNFIKYN